MPRLAEVYRVDRYTDKAGHGLIDDFWPRLEMLVTNAYPDHDLDAAPAAHAELVEDAETEVGCRRPPAGRHRRCSLS